MPTVNIHEAKTHLSRLIETAISGEPVIIAKAGKPLVKLIALDILMFSVASIWEVAIKRGLDRPDFRVDPRLLRRGLMDNFYEELSILGQHTVAVDGLPRLHSDPFDRILIAQAMVEGVTLLTADPMVARYQAPVRLV
jgi:prevent-host-death family protein